MGEKQMGPAHEAKQWELLRQNSAFQGFNHAIIWVNQVARY
jgi:hypothetical protein